MGAPDSHSVYIPSLGEIGWDDEMAANLSLFSSHQHTGGPGLDPVAFTSLTSIPVTTKGDLLAFSTVAGRFAVGADGKVLTSDSTKPFGMDWKASSVTLDPNSGDISNVGASASAGSIGQATDAGHIHKMGIISTKGDLLAFSTGPVRFPKGADGTVLVSDSTSTTGFAWAVPSVQSTGRDVLIGINTSTSACAAVSGRTGLTTHTGSDIGALINLVMKDGMKVGPVGSQSMGTPGSSIQCVNVGPDNSAAGILAGSEIGKPIQRGTAGVISGASHKTFTQAGANFVADDVGRIVIIYHGANGTDTDLMTTIAARTSATVVTLADAGTDGSYSWCEPVTVGAKLYGQGGAKRGQGGLHPDKGSLMFQAQGAGWNTNTGSRAVLDYRNAGSWTSPGSGSEMFEWHDIAFDANGLAEYAICGMGGGTGNRAVGENFTAQGATVANIGVGNLADIGGASSDVMLHTFVSTQPNVADGSVHGLQINLGDTVYVDIYNLNQPNNALVIQSGGVVMIGRGHAGGSGSGTPIKIIAVAQCELGPGLYVDNIKNTTTGGIWIAPASNSSMQSIIIHPDTRFNLNDANAIPVVLDGGTTGYTGINQIRIGGMTNGFGTPPASFVRFINNWRPRMGVTLDHIMGRQLAALWSKDGSCDAELEPDWIGGDIMIQPSSFGTPGMSAQRLRGTLSATGKCSIACWPYAAPTYFTPGIGAAALTGFLSAAYFSATVDAVSDGVSLPTATVGLSSTTGLADAGSVALRINTGHMQVVHYTSLITPGGIPTIAGCTGGTGVLHTGQQVQAVTLISGGGATDSGKAVAVEAKVLAS